LKPENAYSREALHAYQRVMIDWIKTRPGCALYCEMGLGKSICVLTALVDLIATFDTARVLIIAPLRVARHTWPAEIARWMHTRGLFYTVLTGSPATREAKLRDSATIHIINRELVEWLVKFWGKRWPYDTVVIDESSSFKSPRAKRFKALKKERPYINRLIELTGTPASNGLLDLWSQVYLIDKGERLGRTYSGFRDAYFESDYMGYNWTPRPFAHHAIYKKLDDVCLTLTADDYLTLPERIDNIVTVEMPKRARAQYRELERECLLEIEDDTITAFNAATLTGKLRQCANGALYTDENGAWAKVHDAKLDALGDIIEEAAGAPLLVAYEFKSDCARIKEWFKHARLFDADVRTLDDWNAGKIPLLIAHPASAGHGLNLQAGGHIVAWFGLPWSLELYQQFNARLHRQGQEKPVFVHHVVTEGTVDEIVLAALGEKDVGQRDLLSALKKDLKANAEAELPTRRGGQFQRPVYARHGHELMG
jgi:SNF2 family DNA or RNA helicase